MADYKERFVAYVNILGFEALMGRPREEEGSISPTEFIEALEVPTLAEAEQIIRGRIDDIYESGHRMTAFANRIAITVEPTARGLLQLLHHVARIGYRLIRLKTPILCRGGITRGQLYHDGQVIFGPALNEVYSMEKQQAKYPRIILTEEVIRVGLEAEPPIDAIFKRFVRRDEADGSYFVNILRVLRMSMDYEKVPSTGFRAKVNRIEQHLRQEIERLSGEEREGLLWFQKYFDWATDRSSWQT